MTAARASKSSSGRGPESRRPDEPPGAKRLQRNGQATQQRILDAAFVEFAAAGFAGARIERIAAAAGCNRSLIFVHFKSKSALFETVVGRELERLEKEVNRASGDARRFAARLFDFAMENPSSMRLLAWHGLEVESNLRARGHEPPLNEDALANPRFWPGEFGASPPANSCTAIVALATAWSQGNPIGQLLSSNDNTVPRLPRDIVMGWVARLID